MKKILYFQFAVILVISLFGCDMLDDEDSDIDTTPEPGKSKLEVTINYSGSGDYLFGNTDSSKAGTAKNYIYLYKDLGAESQETTRNYVGIDDTNNSTITIDSIKAGNYYIVVFYDYYGYGGDPKPDDELLNKTDPYSIYNGEGNSGTQLVSNAKPFRIGEETTESLTIDFNEGWTMGTNLDDDDNSCGKCFLTE